ncbi:MAG: RidA family protein [Devosia sp.]
MIEMLNPAGTTPNPSYSQGALVAAGQRTLYIAGQVGVDHTGNLGKDIAEQTRIATDNVRTVLAEAGMSVDNLAKVTIYLTDESLIPGFVEAAAGTLSSPPPPATLLIVKALAAPPLLVEIEAIAHG